MFDFLKKKKGSGNWPPQGEADGRQQECALPQSGSSSSPDPGKIKEAIKRKYAEVAISPDGKFAYPTGRAGAEALGYDPAYINEAPASLIKSFCGVGNPFSLGVINQGATVLDVGSGAGFDLYVASRLVGKSGRICGIDLTEEMVDLASQELTGRGLDNIEILHVSSEKIPYGDNTFDTIISNGVINLSPCKEELFKDIFRVMKKGGRLQFADVILEKEMPGTLVGSAEAWSQWIGGTIPVRDQLRLMERVGFVKVECLGHTGFRTSKYTVGALFRATKPE